MGLGLLHLSDCRDRVLGPTDAAAQLPVVTGASQVEKPEMCVLPPWLLLDSEAVASDTTARAPELQTLTLLFPQLYLLCVFQSVQDYIGILSCWHVLLVMN